MNKFFKWVGIVVVAMIILGIIINLFSAKKVEAVATTQSASKDSTTVKTDDTNSSFDTAGVYLAPVKILEAKITKDDEINIRNIYLSFKNVSGKKITSIRFKWWGINAFGEPADMDLSSDKGLGSGFIDDELGIGKISNATWQLWGQDAKKIIAAWPYEVAFDDGTKWSLNP
jgi:hypothetical protein